MRSVCARQSNVRIAELLAWTASKIRSSVAGNICVQFVTDLSESLMAVLPNAPMTRKRNISPKSPVLSVQLLLIGLLCTTAGPALSQGQLSPGQRATRAVTRAEDELGHPGESDQRWHLAIGLVSNYSPEYSGSDRMGHAFAPAARIDWRGYSISRSSVTRASSRGHRASETGLAGPLWHLDRFSFGLGLSLNHGRDVSDADQAKGLRPLRGTLIGRVRIRYDLTKSIQIQTRLVGDVLGRQGGFEIPVGVAWQHPLSKRLLLSADTGFTWANRTAMRNSYGIGNPEHKASGLPLYEPASGMREVGSSVTLTGEPNEHWIWVVRASLVRLTGPAARSPIVKRHLMPSLLAGGAFRFSL